MLVQDDLGMSLTGRAEPSPSGGTRYFR